MEKVGHKADLTWESAWHNLYDDVNARYNPPDYHTFDVNLGDRVKSRVKTMCHMILDAMSGR